MSRHIVVGTAGHVDHGKTALVKALTGIDTDRWEEEKRRGITIDLGFAHLDLGDDVHASIVDVPGHEDFVRNMVAGATGVDVALLVVAADEGVMPQTTEHLAILEFLGVPTGAVAVTKTDLAEPDWLELVVSDLNDRLEGSSLRWEKPVCVSAKTGEGLDELRGAVARAAAGAAARNENDLFRMPVDRVFSVAGAGTVVTGTAWTGTVRTGDDVFALPAGTRARVRSIEVHGQSAPAALPGRRTALALVGIEREAVSRGSAVVHDPNWRATRRVDVLISLLPHARPVTQRSRVRLHLGTAEVMARVTPAAGEIAPGASGVVRLRLEEPIACRWGDRGVLRSYSPVTTVGGCLVIDPLPDPRPRRPSQAAGRYSDDANERLVTFTAARRAIGLPLSDLPVRLGFRPDEVIDDPTTLSSLGLVVTNGRLYTHEVAEQACGAAQAAVAAFHEQNPLQPGIPLEAFRLAAGSQPLADFARTALEDRAEIVVERGLVRLADHAPTLAGANAESGVRVEKALQAGGPHGVDLAVLQELVSEGSAVDLAEYFVRSGTAVRVAPDRYYSRKAVDEVSLKVVDHLDRVGEASPADLREVLGLSRKYLIPLLEWLDAQGITMRAGDVRRLGQHAGRVSRG